jgi:hypothetical protein
VCADLEGVGGVGEGCWRMERLEVFHVCVESGVWKGWVGRSGLELFHVCVEM